jgi:hypothetical protein
MKNSSIFWGIFFLSLGIYFLLERFGIIKFQFGEWVNVWPLFLIFLGLSFLSIPKVVKLILTGLSALVLTIFLIGLCSNFCCPFNWFIGKNSCEINIDDSLYGEIMKTDSLREPFDSLYKTSKLTLDAGAVSIEMKDSCQELLNVFNNGIYQEIKYSKSVKDSSIDINVSFENNKLKINGKSSKNIIQLLLNPNPIWEFNFDIGAAKFDSDIRRFKVKTINLDAGAASISMDIGDLVDSTYINIDAGASSIHLTIPVNSGCIINTDAGLSSKHFEDFTKNNDGNYISNNYNNTKKKIFINFDGGISSFRVNKR